MHAVGTGATEAMKKIKALGLAFGIALVQRVASYYAIGILYDWHVFTWFYIWGNYNNWAINIENWGWMIEWTPAFLGSGMLVGLNTASKYCFAQVHAHRVLEIANIPQVSMFSGTFFAWGFMGPILVHYGICIGKAYDEEDPKWGGYVSFYSMSGINDPDYIPSPRYWFLWPGVMVLVCYSMAEFLVHWKVLYYGAKYAWKSAAGTVNELVASRRQGRGVPFLERQSRNKDDNRGLVEDFATPEQQVSTWVWVLGSVVVVVMTCIIGELQFHISAGLCILASLLAIVFAFLSIHGAGVTDIAPLTASAKASQLVFGGITSGQGLGIKTAQATNLVAGGIASGAADMSASLVSDFRVGFLLRTPPNLQFWAQGLGTVVAMFLAPGMLIHKVRWFGPVCC